MVFGSIIVSLFTGIGIGLGLVAGLGTNNLYKNTRQIESPEFNDIPLDPIPTIPDQGNKDV